MTTPLRCATLDHVAEALDLATHRKRDDLDQDRVFALALIKLVEIVGEAADRVSKETQAAHDEIPWRQIIGMRHRLVRGYDVVDYAILWRIVESELPGLLVQVESMLSETASSGGGG